VAETLITDRRSASAHYTILRKLGKGGMAEVFLARQEGMAGFRRLTVVKKILPQFSQVSDVAEMLLDEARIAAQLSHPNIVQIYELGKDEGQYFISMEFVDGCDLATLARIERHRQSRVPLRLTLRVVAEAAMGLDYAHRQGGLDGRPLNIVHRDVSPHNIMCSREGAVKVTDFGIAKAVGKGQVTQVGVVKGKVQYMSPEQYTGAPVDHRSDIFSLGVILYQLSTGRLPRVTDSGEVVLRRVLEGRIPRPSEIRGDYPDELEAIVMRALAHNPEDRYPDAAGLRDDLLDFARENDLLAFPKELGEYVNALVPPTPLVVRELSVIAEPAKGREASAVVSKARRSVPDQTPTPAVIVEGEDRDTDAPSGTEVASPRASRKRGSQVITDHRSDPYDRTEIPIHGPDSSPALLKSERMTPLAKARDLLPARRDQHTDDDESGDTGRVSRDGKLRRIEPLSSHGEEARDRDDPPRDAPDAEPPTGRRSPKRSDEDAKRERPEERRAEARPAQSPPTAETRTDTMRRRPALVWFIGAGVFAVVAAAVMLLGARYLWSADPPNTPGTTPGTTVILGAGVITVLANPPNAAVSIDGAQRCPSTPCQIAGLPLNRELLLTLRATGYTLWMQRLVLTTSDPKLSLRADLTPGSTERLSPDAGPRVKDDKKGKRWKATGGDPTKKGGNPTKGEVKSGKRGPRAKSQGKMVVEPSESEQPMLAVDVRPWAEVWIDGKKVGHTPRLIPLTPGAHKIELKNPDLNFSKTYRAKVAKNQKVKISEMIQPPGAPDGPQ
jgi:serine/threonine protein kinase